MNKKLYLVYENGYIEDYCLIYATTELEIVSNYCNEFNKDMLPLDEFYETHTVDVINCICGKEINEIIFK